MIYLDANVILRYLLHDDVKFKDQATEYLETYDIYIKNEVFAEVVYVLNKTYNIPKSELCKTLRELLNYENIYMESKDVALMALDIFEKTNIDFVDSLLCSYNRLKNLKIITFDKKLKKCIEEKTI